MCEKMSVYAAEQRDQVYILRLCCGCGVRGSFPSLPAVVVGSVGSLLQCCHGLIPGS